MSSAHSAPPPPLFSPSAWARDAARFPGTQLLGGAGVGGWRPGPSSPCPPAAPPGSGPVPLSGTLLPPSALPAARSCGAASRALPSLCTAPPLGPAAPTKEPPLPAPSSPCSGHGLPVPPLPRRAHCGPGLPRRTPPGRRDRRPLNGSALTLSGDSSLPLRERPPSAPGAPLPLLLLPDAPTGQHSASVTYPSVSGLPSSTSPGAAGGRASLLFSAEPRGLQRRLEVVGGRTE